MTALSSLTATLESVWASIQERNPDVPNALIVIGPAEKKRGGFRKLGHFSPRRWATRALEDGTPMEDASYHEVLVVAEELARPALDVFTTLAHESVHALAENRGIKDTSRQHRYHNRRFLTLAEEVGLFYPEDKPDPTIGFSAVRPFAETEREYAEAIAALAVALDVYRKAIVPGAKDPGKSKSQEPAECACNPPRLLRVSNKFLEEGAPTCPICERPFSRADLDLSNPEDN